MSARRKLLQGAAAATGAVAMGPWALLAQAAAQVPAAQAGALTWQNWSGLETCRPASLLTPSSEDELREVLRRGTGPLRCVGAGHSFTALVPTDGSLLSLDRLSGIVRTDARAGTVTVRAGTRLAVLSRLLDAQGLALHNLPDIDTQTVAGALATATHGTGAELPALHAHVRGLRLVTARGERLACSAQERPELLAAAQVSLGSLGVVTEVDLAVRPRYRLHRHVWLEKTPALLAQALELAQKHRQFEMFVLPFTGYSAAVTHDETEQQPSTAQREAHDDEMLDDLKHLRNALSRWPALRQWVAQKLIDPKLQEDAVDWSWKLLSTVRPWRFNETEAHLPRANGPACLAEVIAAIERQNEAYFPIEFRFVAADAAWLSPFQGRASCSIAAHAAYGERHDYLVNTLGPIFRKHGGRPHWGKLHDYRAGELAAAYPQWARFQALRRELDPQGRLLNPYLRGLFGAGHA